MTPEQRIRQLVQDGKMPPAEGDRLIAAMHAVARPGLLDRVDARVGAVAFVAVAALQFGASRFGVRFDGPIDLHVHPGAAAVGHALFDGFASLLLPAVLFFAAARVLGKSVRFVDFLGVVALARAPMLVAALPACLIALHLRNQPLVIVLAFVLLAFLAASIALSYRGFKVASGLTGRRLVIAFVGSLVFGELIAKLLSLVT
jgi:hypothetical protein